MMLKPKVLLYFITIVVIVAAIVWEFYMQQWLSYQPDGGKNVMRSDLFVIWPVVLTLVAISVFRIFKKDE
jgi:small-conductance mechanosensitive channel